MKRTELVLELLKLARQIKESELEVVASNREDVEKAIGNKFDSGTARTIGNKTSHLKRIGGGAKEKAEIKEKLIKAGYSYFKDKGRDVFSKGGTQSIVVVTPKTVRIAGRTRTSLLVEHIEEGV